LLTAGDFGETSPLSDAAVDGHDAVETRTHAAIEAAPIDRTIRPRRPDRSQSDDTFGGERARDALARQCRHVPTVERKCNARADLVDAWTVQAHDTCGWAQNGAASRRISKYGVKAQPCILIVYKSNIPCSIVIKQEET
jgi:hypothetical protein